MYVYQRLWEIISDFCLPQYLLTLCLESFFFSFSHFLDILNSELQSHSIWRLFLHNPKIPLSFSNTVYLNSLLVLIHSNYQNSESFYLFAHFYCLFLSHQIQVPWAQIKCVVQQYIINTLNRRPLNLSNELLTALIT